MVSVLGCSIGSEVRMSNWLNWRVISISVLGLLLHEGSWSLGRGDRYALVLDLEFEEPASVDFAAYRLDVSAQMLVNVRSSHYGLSEISHSPALRTPRAFKPLPYRDDPARSLPKSFPAVTGDLRYKGRPEAAEPNVMSEQVSMRSMDDADFVTRESASVYVKPERITREVLLSPRLAPLPVPQSHRTYSLTSRDRDLVIRTILGEAANQGKLGQTAVAHVILNRVQDSRWSNTPEGVVMQPRAFSAWNKDSSGNSLVRKGSNSRRYVEIGQIVDAVFAGDTIDPTDGATHYYSPLGMQDLVRRGYQSNVLPSWLSAEQRHRRAPDIVIGDHIFTGRASPK